jgi:DNA-binding PadR family transcriptional regulator
MGHEPLGATEFHVLLALTRGTLYGYAIMKAVEEESGGRISPEIGSLYRLLTRLLSKGLVEETSHPRGEDEPHPGRERRYYRLTSLGRSAVRSEARRLREVLQLAASRAVLRGGGEA